jgi:hypothetical protein
MQRERLHPPVWQSSAAALIGIAVTGGLLRHFDDEPPHDEPPRIAVAMSVSASSNTAVAWATIVVQSL